LRFSWGRRHLPRAGLGWALPAVVLSLTLLAAGCGGSGGDNDGVASLRGSNGTTTTTNGGADREQALLDFSRCMREQGVPIQDPQVDSQGNLRLQPAQGGLGDVDQATLDKAREACQEHLEGVTQGFTPEDQTRMEDSLVKYASCMRQNGYDMPDPDFSQGQGAVRGFFGSLDQDDPAYKKAHEACKQHLAQLQGGGAGGGGNSGGGSG
jgi:hypothetical protein